MSFDALSVPVIESHRATEIDTPIPLQGDVPLVAQGQFDRFILLTGVGARLLNKAIGTRWPAGAFAEAHI